MEEYNFFIPKGVGRLCQRAAVVALSIMLCACAGPGTTGRDEVVLAKAGFSQDETGHPYNLFPKYEIVPGDVLDVLFQIQTWTQQKEFRLAVDNVIAVNFVSAPELDEEQTVRPDGRISLPYIGEIYVVGKTVEELTQELRAKYAGVLRDPELYITIPEFQSSIRELKKDLHTAPRGLSRLVRVRPDGFVTFPMIGDLFVAGKSIPQVNAELNERYAKILPNLHCDLFLEKHSGSMVYVLGEVNKPGVYPVSRPVSVIEALALAGSYKNDAKLGQVYVVRRKDDKLVAKRLDLTKTLAFDKGARLFYLRPDDVVYVPRKGIFNAADLSMALGDIIFFRGWSIGIRP